MRKVICIAGLWVLSSALLFGQNHPKYVFFFIGDGMSFAQVEAANMYLKATSKDSSGLRFCAYPVRAAVYTSAYQHPITCSAAAGTALATGNKTKMGTLGLGPDEKTKFQTVAELAHQSGRKVGIITSVYINHATPAAFYAKVAGREDYYAIGQQLLNSQFNYFAGGMIKDANQTGNEGLYDKARQQGYTVVQTRDQFNSLKKGADKVIAGSVELNGGENIAPRIDRGTRTISLANYVTKGIELLDNPAGFFMMCEGGQIDWACHANDAASMVNEVIDFDDAVGVALDFYAKHPDQTLIVITADHETGGLSLGNARMDYELAPANLRYQQVSADYFENNVMGSIKRIERPVSLEQVNDSVKKYFHLGSDLPLDAYDQQRLNDAYRASFLNENETALQRKFAYEKHDPVSTTAAKLVAEKAGFGWTTFAHTAMPVPVRAIGAGADLFNNLSDNTQVGKVLMKMVK